MRTFNIWISGALTVSAIASAGAGIVWWAMLGIALAALNLYAGTRKP